MSDIWNRRTLTVDNNGKGINQGAKEMTIGDAHALVDRLSNATEDIKRRINRLDGGTPDRVDPEYFVHVHVNRALGTVNGDDMRRELSRNVAPSQDQEVLPEFHVRVNRALGTVGED